jgi:hypothetical protein
LGGDVPDNRRLSEELQHLIAAFGERSVQVREVLEIMQGRGYTLLLILLTFPFCTPIPLPGLSSPFGLVVAFIGLRLAFGQKPWLPERLLNTRLPARFFPKLLSATRRVVRGLEWLSKARLTYIFDWRVVQHGIGIIIFVCGLLLVLPLPIPFSNGFPAFTVLLLAMATIEKDGYMAMAGGGLFVLTLAFFATIFWGGAEVAVFLKDFFGDMFKPDDEPVSGN